MLNLGEIEYNLGAAVVMQQRFVWKNSDRLVGKWQTIHPFLCLLQTRMLLVGRFWISLPSWCRGIR